ncbi:unnamed protein product [Heligmosomoides polygyrus]|uniref:E3 ubiquitin-protein ligase n=1 Tax=Heligmosomoides polygyrus TaxID=6339 RepID=A0A183F5W6_HELPZ|nr:unnamed protein product [Heligmosomoides polygyrus]
MDGLRFPGAIGNSIHATCAVACSVLFKTAATGTLGSVKVVEFVDIKEEVERQFVRELQSKFASTQSDTAVATGSSDGIWKYAKPAEKIQEDDCVICLSALDESKEVCELPCSHQYHVGCFSNYLDSASSKKCCAMCCKYFDLPLGNQPEEARMHVHKDYSLKLPGHEDSEFTYQIIYTVPSGLQDASHIRPGKPFTGTRRVAYVPGSADGSKVLRLLKFAFDRRLIFTGRFKPRRQLFEAI